MAVKQIMTISENFRACLKNHSRHLYNDAYASYSPLCVIFAPNSVNIARYVSFIRHKSPTNCDAHLTESIFQTRSSGFSVGNAVKMNDGSNCVWV